MFLSQWDKLIKEILSINKNLRFEDLSKVLQKMGYTVKQPKSGSSHFTFRKAGCMPITIPKQQPLNKAYIIMIKKAVEIYLSSEE